MKWLLALVASVFFAVFYPLVFIWNGALELTSRSFHNLFPSQKPPEEISWLDFNIGCMASTFGVMTVFLMILGSWAYMYKEEQRVKLEINNRAKKPL